MLSSEHRSVEAAAFMHKLQSAEMFLLAKVHAMLGIGGEATEALLLLLRSNKQHSESSLGQLLSSLLQPLITHDELLSYKQQQVWQKRDVHLVTQLRLRHLAVKLNQERPEFTLAQPATSCEVS
jgi:hypothetical protein